MVDCRVGHAPEQVLATFALGSCIGLSVRPEGAVGGMPTTCRRFAIDPARSRQNPYMFADTGIAKLVEQVCGVGANKRRLIAHAAGGASMMDPQAVFDIGKRNYLALRKILWKAGILLAGESVGGTTSRTIRLEIGSGRLWLQENGKQKELVPSFPQKGGN